MTTHPLDAISKSFWDTVDLARQDAARFQETLETMTREQLLEFIWKFQEVAAEFKSEPYTDQVSQELSEDGVDDVATSIVEQGRDHTYQVFDDPTRMPKRVDYPVGYLSKAVRTFYKRFGGPIPLRP